MPKANNIAMLLALAITTTAFAKCHSCGEEHKSKNYPAYSAQLQTVIEQAAKKSKATLSKNDKTIINKIIWKENRTGNLTAMNNGCYGLGQGKRATYQSLGIPWKTTCPVLQVEMIIRYIKNRYKTFDRAWNHHIRYNWY